MPSEQVLIEIHQGVDDAFEAHAAATASVDTAYDQAADLVADLAGFGVELTAELAPVPMYAEETISGEETSGRKKTGFGAFSSRSKNDDTSAASVVVAAEIDTAKRAELESRDDITVWPNSKLTLLEGCGCCEEIDGEHPFDLARADGGLDCRPFRPPVSIAVLRCLLGVQPVWDRGSRGQNVFVGIIDEGIDGSVYPVVGGFARATAGRQPGSAPVTSHGSMCAADVLVAAPAASLYDYPFLGVPRSGGALQMFQAVLDQRRRDGTPHLTSNSYGFVGVPPKAQFPRHEVWDIDHPVHRKVREVVVSGAPCLFAAGNCGQDCPSGNCHVSGIGPGKSIHASNSLEEVITVAAVNSRHERIGYSSQGEGMFARRKPDISAYSHFNGNLGPGRPAGGTSFDNGTSAACPVAAGVGAILLGAFPNASPAELKKALIDGAASIGQPGWDRDYGHGVVNAASAYAALA